MQHTVDTHSQHSTQQSLNNPHRSVVVALQICPGHRKPMQHRETVEALTTLGLKGDIHALAESTRQVLLIDQETLQDLGLSPGQVKENITTERIAVAQLEPGQRLRVGSTVLHITMACSPCRQMDEIQPGLQAELRGRRGMLARVVEGGEIRVGDLIDPLP